MTRRRALISVSHKAGVVTFCRGLHARGWEILSTGGTAAALRAADVPVTDVSAYTGFPEMMDGRVKTLHPRIHGALLGRRELPDHRAAMDAHGIVPIDLLAVNLYPFADTIARPGCTPDEGIENIDIGGPAMVRSAAKNHAHVTVITDPADYPLVLGELAAHGDSVSLALRQRLAGKAFAMTAAYDAAIAAWLTAPQPGAQPVSQATGATQEAAPPAADPAPPFPERLSLGFVKAQTLRYGENPHQQAAFYRDPEVAPGLFAGYAQIQGKELSFNNIADADAAWECVRGLAAAACVIVKHANPCGVALGREPVDAYRAAFATDPTSAFGGILAFNRPVDEAAARALLDQFVEVLLAPAYTPGALSALASKPNIRVLTVPLADGRQRWEFKRVGGGLLVQSADAPDSASAPLRTVTHALPSETQLADLRFAFHVAQFVKSNAIVFCREGRTLGIGAGQMSRVDSTRIARLKAQDAGLRLQGAACASDAFFPFRDGVDVIAAAGATAIIQPGGSLRDDEVIRAADEHGIAMVFTGIRHFRH